MIEQHHAREYLMGVIRRSCHSPDRHQLITRDLCETAFPATGMQDHRMTKLGVTRGEFLSLALALGGHRPDPGLSTQEQMARALSVDGRVFRVYSRHFEDAYEVHRVK